MWPWEVLLPQWRRCFLLSCLLPNFDVTKNGDNNTSGLS